MIVHVFNGARQGEVDVDRLADAARVAAESGGHQTVPWTLRDHDFTFCRGCFRCWVATPGTCSGTHADRDVARRLADADILVMTTSLTFGCYSSELKIALDHAIPMLTYDFERWAGETHQQLRYGRFPPILAVASATRRDAAAEAVYSTLLWRTSFNSRAPSAAAVFSPGDGVDRIVERLAAILAGLTGRPSQVTPSARVLSPELPHLVLPQRLDLAEVGPGELETDPQPPKRALLLVGSPKPGLKPSSPDDRSASLALGRALARRLFGHGVEGQTLFLCETVRISSSTKQMLASVASADLVILSFPLSIDCLPAPAIRALELIADARRHCASRHEPQRPGFFALCQSGFPEAEQSATALAVCRRFAEEAGFAWRGGLAVGGGPAVASQLRAGGLGRHAVRALDLAAAELASGRAVPLDVVRCAARAAMPAVVYRRAAESGFRRQARQYGMRRASAVRPFEPQEG